MVITKELKFAFVCTNLKDKPRLCLSVTCDFSDLEGYELLG